MKKLIILSFYHKIFLKIVFKPIPLKHLLLFSVKMIDHQRWTNFVPITTSPKNFFSSLYPTTSMWRSHINIWNPWPCLLSVKILLEILAFNENFSSQHSRLLSRKLYSNLPLWVTTPHHVVLISQAIVSVGGQWAPLCIIWYHTKKKQFLVILNNICDSPFSFLSLGAHQKLEKSHF